MESLSHTMDAVAGVEVVAWPREQALRQSLARAGIPRLLIVADGQAAPEDLAFDEEWIREPFDVADIRVRARQILRAVRSQSSQASWLDQERVLHRGHRTVVLTASEAVVADELLAHPDQVVTREALHERLWPDGDAPSDRAVDAIVYRLRRRCRDLGLLIRSARGLGFVMSMGPVAAMNPGQV